jgi:integrase
MVYWQMGFLPSNSALTPVTGDVRVRNEANSSLPLKGEYERMARRRFQKPKPFREGAWWWIFVRKDVFIEGKPSRRKERVKLAPATMPEREARKVADEHLSPINQGLQSIGSATNFAEYVNETYIPVVLPLMATTTQDRYGGVIKNYLLPAFRQCCLRDLTTLKLQRYFSAMVNSPLSHESRDKIRDVMSGILGSAVGYHLLVNNPMEGVKLPKKPVGRRDRKPNITFAQFEEILARIPEPYATMVYVAVYSGLRVSELIGLRWNDLLVVEVDETGQPITTYSIMVDERFSRGDWSEPKSEASKAAVAVQRHVIERILALKLKTVSVRAGTAVRHYMAVKNDGPDDLVFQSVKDGKPMRDNNILTRFIKPAARKVGLGFVNWLCLRRSYGTWLKRQGADMKDIQGQMRHAKLPTTMDLYVQDIPESRRRAVEKLPVPTVVQ